VLTVCSLSIAVAAVVALVGISNGFARSFHDVYASHGVDLVVSRRGAADRLSSAMDESAADRIHHLEGIDRAAGLLLETMSLEKQEIYGIPTLGIRPDSWLLRDYRLVEGRSLQEGDGRSVLLGVQLAARIGRGAGEKVVFFEDEEYDVAGVFESFSAWENSSLILPLEELQRLTDREAQLTYVNVVLEGRASQEALNRAVQSIEAMEDRLLAMPTEDFVETDARMRLAGAMAWMTSSIALLIGATGIFSTMMTSVYERTHEIGILRAVGWRQSRVVRMILMESGLLSLSAAFLGSLGGILITWAMSYAPAVAGTIVPAIDGWVILLAFLIAVAIGLLGASYPAFRAARLAPTQALRHD
jgi:putative ABC transport system permease protein